MATLDKLGESHDVDLTKAKERICQDTNSLKQAQAIHSNVLSKHDAVQLDSLKPKANVQEVSNLKFIPSIEDQQQQRTNYIILTSRILVQYFKVLQPLKEACIQHIPHKDMAEMSQKSKKVINYYSTFYIPFVPEAREMHLAKFMATVHSPIMISSVFTMKMFKSITYWI